MLLNKKIYDGIKNGTVELIKVDFDVNAYGSNGYGSGDDSAYDKEPRVDCEWPDDVYIPYEIKSKVESAITAHTRRRDVECRFPSYVEVHDEDFDTCDETTYASYSCSIYYVDCDVND